MDGVQVPFSTKLMKKSVLSRCLLGTVHPSIGHSLVHVFVHLAFPLHFLCSHPVQASNIVLCIENDGPERIKYTVDHGEWSCSLNSEQVQLHGRIPWTSDCKWLNVNEG